MNKDCNDCIYYECRQVDDKIIENILKEKTNEQIADLLGFSVSVIKRRLEKIFRLYKVKTKAGLVREIMKLRFSPKESLA